ncbi:MAG: excinuclease ABC subunit UvrC [Clostridia bacterium]|jgi:excinuclease ABC subunit C|nr:excinuclease ABC subunit UvrC [Clostridia bacterium]MCI8945092.1 excinuclease ABC subunit UvrC [Clostridia bacterium]MCI9290771.1 excinuclease ABC subunit UvrC [Clostridia bacterium]
MDMIRQKLKDLPTQSGVYIMKSQSGQILYVGKARNLKNRVNQYFANSSNKTEKTIRLVSHIADFEYIITANEIEALVLENNLIKKHKPPYNIMLKDDKSYPFVRINVKQDFPKVEVVRKLKNDGAKYFGPYMQGITSKDILQLVESAFCLRSCSHDLSRLPKSHRPCLNYHINRCLAPCDGHCSKEAYAKQIEGVISFLSGNDKKVAALLEEKMTAAAEREDFELAIFYRRKLEVLDKLVRRQVTALPKDFDLDIFAIATNGLNSVVSVLFVRGGKLVGGDKQVVNDLAPSDEVVLSNFILAYYDKVKYIADEVVVASAIDEAELLGQYLTQKKGSKVNIILPHQGIRRQLADMALNNAGDYLEKSLSIKEREDNMTLGAIMQLQEYLGLPNMPIRMECYDISHVQGTDKVASMVVFSNGAPNKAHYRKFKMKYALGNDDFAGLQEALTRRIDELAKGEDESFATRPDLLVIDGGKGQLSSVVEILQSKGADDISVIGLAKREEEVFVPHQSQPIILPRNSYALKVLQRIRDEAHRFAITFHRSLRQKRQTHSKLLVIDGVGEKRVKALFDAFKNLENIKNATVEDLLLVKCIDRRAAENIYNHFHPKTE